MNKFPTTEELAHWRKVAENATPGPWKGRVGKNGVLTGSGYASLYVVRPEGYLSDENVQHIATFNPALILQWIGWLEQDAKLRELLKRARIELGPEVAEHDVLVAAIDAALKGDGK